MKAFKYTSKDPYDNWLNATKNEENQAFNTNRNELLPQPEVLKKTQQKKILVQ